MYLDDSRGELQAQCHLIKDLLKLNGDVFGPQAISTAKRLSRADQETKRDGGANAGRGERSHPASRGVADLISQHSLTNSCFLICGVSMVDAEIYPCACQDMSTSHQPSRGRKSISQG